MNNYGIKWAHIGLGGLFEQLRQRYVGRVASVLFPHLGGSSLDHEHSYLVHYDTQSDQEGLDVHHDSCDITFNAALDESSSYAGAGLTFCGLYSTPLYRNYSFTVRPLKDAPSRASHPAHDRCRAAPRALLTHARSAVSPPVFRCRSAGSTGTSWAAPSYTTAACATAPSPSRRARAPTWCTRAALHPRALRPATTHLLLPGCSSRAGDVAALVAVPRVARVRGGAAGRARPRPRHRRPALREPPPRRRLLRLRASGRGALVRPRRAQPLHALVAPPVEDRRRPTCLRTAPPLPLWAT